MKLTNLIAIGSLLTMVPAYADHNQTEAVARIKESTAVLNEVMGIKESGIPQDLLDRAHCAVIVLA